MGISNLFGLARNALTSQAAALDVAGSNITNVNTPGYVKRSAVLTHAAAGGVDFQGVQRTWDRFVFTRATQAAVNAGAAEAHDDYLSLVEGIVGDMGDNGIGAALGGFFSSLSALATTPNEQNARANVLAQAQSLGVRFNQMSLALAQLRGDMADEAKHIAEEVTDRASQIAKLNGQILAAKNSGQDAADLEDNRDHLVDELASRIDIQLVADSDGRYMIRAAGGTLVEGAVAATVSVDIDADGNMQLLMQRGHGAPEDMTRTLSGGILSGMFDARDEDAVAMLDRLDNLAFDLATAINGQHAQGFGLDGQSGRNLFEIGATAEGAASAIGLAAGMDGNTDAVAAAATADTLSGGSDNAVALRQIANARVASGGTRTPAEAYSDIIGDIGLRKSASARNAAVRDDMLSQAQTMRDATTGVSVDEEMVQLSRYQRAYQAATKLLSTVDELLATLIQGV